MATTDTTVQPVAGTTGSISRRRLLEVIWLVFLQIFLTILLITFLVPALWMVSSSLKASTEVFAHPIVWIPETPQWQNYARLFEILPFGRFTWNTFIVVFFAVIGTLLCSIFTGYSFARLRWPGRDLFFAILIATLMLPEVITLVPRFIIFRYLQWIDTLLPLIIPFWFGATPGTPLYIFLMRQFFKGLPLELEEAALIDGASRLRILFQIVLPLSKPVIATVAVFAMLQHYTDFMNPLIYISSVNNWTLALGVAGLNAEESFRSGWELVFVAGTLMTIPVLILFIFAQRYFVQGIAMTGFGGR
jgi:ABC-type glycerol-3-phosphate transport system permease component